MSACACVSVCQNDDECIWAVQIFSGYRYLCGQSKIPCVVKCVYSQGKTTLVILLSGDTKIGFSYAVCIYINIFFVTFHTLHTFRLSRD